MSYVYNDKISFCNCCFNCYDCVDFNIVLNKSKPTLIQGVVSNPNGNIVKNACIEVFEICNKSHKKTILGYVFTNEFGEYGFTLNIKQNVDYIFNVYSSL